ncbi:MAG: hypothetical protein ACTSYS_17030 [Promethearchaeota archaeon]
MSLKLIPKLNTLSQKFIKDVRVSFSILTIINTAVITHFLLVVVRSFIIAPAILNELLPILAWMLIVPFVVAFLTMIFNDVFLGLIGNVLLSIGRAFLIFPASSKNLEYYIGMDLSILGTLLSLLGLFGIVFKDLKLNSGPATSGFSISSIAVGFIIGFVLNVSLRMPGIELSENPIFNMMIVVVFLISGVKWYDSVELKRKLLKNVEFSKELKRKGEKKFRKSLHLLMLGPIFGIFGNIYNRYEYFADITDLGYFLVGYTLVLAFLGGLVLVLALRDKQPVGDYLGIGAALLGLLGIGFRYFMPKGNYFLIFVIVPIFSGIVLIEKVIEKAKLARINNVDISTILAWIMVVVALFFVYSLNLLLLFPFSEAIMFSLIAIYLAVELLSRIRHSKTQGKSGGDENGA